MTQSMTRQELVMTAQRMNDMSNNVLEPNFIPLQIHTWSLEGILKPIEGCTWSNENYCKKMKVDMILINDATIAKIYHPGNEHSRVRAMELLNSGVQTNLL